MNEVNDVPNHIVLYQPEIPANTGNIARTCAATQTSLHLIRPLGFSTDDKMLKRAGLDYWKYVNVLYYDSIDEFFSKNDDGQYFYLTKYGKKPHTAFNYSDPSINYYFIFGKETAGLPKELLAKNKETCLRIPMTNQVRSLNLSNAATILLYEALRQQNFVNLH